MIRSCIDLLIGIASMEKGNNPAMKRFIHGRAFPLGGALVFIIPRLKSSLRGRDASQGQDIGNLIGSARAANE